ncbi:hypothetical protein CB0940_09511 [Cercospora beticola]|uniref:WW domain-containing protein n=1 Tax=Cercospora beticola TaxID=122368 RepID=A0A2G5HIG7_CERBT|nr:hypothetical protein CB0940_09511 [Cercospora beticola]PIA91993.1 hypothetical protein CB0940_09511 [Cercospora beticola]WPB06168.1 hypothetical protein RHO25_010825 [Cercospora beticola]CAK1366052.1 unnamed protein product [Cercospora beticola]
MSQEEDFRIKGAAQVADTAAQDPTESTDQPKKLVENADQAEEAEQAQEKEQEGEEIVAGETHDETSADRKLREKYFWYKCENPSQGEGIPTHYFTNTKSGESSWTEPSEPYWLYNTELGGPDPVGLQYPPGAEQPNAAQKSAETHPLRYNPRIHGDYDPNADYAKYTEQRLAEQSGATTYGAAAAAPGTGSADYSSIMALNARTGSAQPSHLSADRHNDFAKSGRQMNAFFDVDAAANAHEGKSLKEERKNKKLSKAEVKAFNEARKEKKQKKRLAFYKS